MKRCKIFIKKLDFFKNKKVVHNQKYNVMAIYIYIYILLRNDGISMVLQSLIDLISSSFSFFSSFIFLS